MNQSIAEIIACPSPPPLRWAEDDAVRVGDTRITLDLIVAEYENGMSAEEIVCAYDVLLLAEVYSAIAFYLQHPQRAREYLRQREQHARELRETIERDRPPLTRTELLARRVKETIDAPTRQ